MPPVTALVPVAGSAMSCRRRWQTLRPPAKPAEEGAAGLNLSSAFPHQRPMPLTVLGGRAADNVLTCARPSHRWAASDRPARAYTSPPFRPPVLLGRRHYSAAAAASLRRGVMRMTSSDANRQAAPLATKAIM